MITASVMRGFIRTLILYFHSKLGVGGKRSKLIKKWAFVLHLKNSSKKMKGGQFKTTCLKENRTNIDVRNGT